MGIAVPDTDFGRRSKPEQRHLYGGRAVVLFRRRPRGRRLLIRSISATMPSPQVAGQVSPPPAPASPRPRHRISPRTREHEESDVRSRAHEPSAPPALTPPPAPTVAEQPEPPPRPPLTKPRRPRIVRSPRRKPRPPSRLQFPPPRPHRPSRHATRDASRQARARRRDPAEEADDGDESASRRPADGRDAAERARQHRRVLPRAIRRFRPRGQCPTPAMGDRGDRAQSRSQPSARPERPLALLPPLAVLSRLRLRLERRGNRDDRAHLDYAILGDHSALEQQEQR